ncbi:MAG: hypothetical protein ACYTDU_13975 [Planctomycetota bacterium]|jgi:hypothetical protein
MRSGATVLCVVALAGLGLVYVKLERLEERVLREEGGLAGTGKPGGILIEETRNRIGRCLS